MRRLKSALLATAVLLAAASLALPAAGNATAISWLMLLLLVLVLFLLVFMVILLTRLSAKSNEINSSIVLYENLERAGYKIKDLFLAGGAADASLLLFLYKCLWALEPSRVLELGSGQSTKLLSCYYHAKQDTGVEVVTLEHDADWIERVRPYITDAGGKIHTYVHAPLEHMSFRAKGTATTIETDWYRAGEELRGSFELIVVDGPPGSALYSRSGLLRYMPELLAPRFVVVFDDCCRRGEIMTIDLFAKMLRAARVEFIQFEIHSLKRQVIFCSADLEFLQWL